LEDLSVTQKKRQYVSFSFGTLGVAALAFAIVSACTDQQAKAKLNIVHKEAPKAGVVANIGGQEIAEEELIGDDKLDFFELKKREYDLKMDRLNRLIVEKLVGAEAKQAGMTLDDYINKKIIGGDGQPKVSESEYKKFIAEKKVPESQLNPQLKERIMAYLQSMKRQELIQAHVSKLTQKEPVEVYFNKPKMQVAVETGNGPMFGDPDAKVKIVEFSDFQCPFCSRAAETVEQLKKKYGNKIAFYYRQFPLPMHSNAMPAAQASLCVNEQGAPKFWKWHDLAFKNQQNLDAASLEKYAKEAGANVDKFKECVAAKKYADAVKTDMEYGEKLGVKSTPTFFINGEILNGALPIDQFSDVIEDEMNQK
jgi:protein-disulfide isomerase